MQDTVLSYRARKNGTGSFGAFEKRTPGPKKLYDSGLNSNGLARFDKKKFVCKLSNVFLV